MIRVLLVDDHTSFRQPLAFMMDREADLSVVGQAGSLAEARRQVRDIDVAVVDLDLPDGSGGRSHPRTTGRKSSGHRAGVDCHQRPLTVCSLNRSWRRRCAA